MARSAGVDKWSRAYGDDLCPLFTLSDAEFQAIEERAQQGTSLPDDVPALLTEMEVLRRACYYYMTRAQRGRKPKK